MTVRADSVRDLHKGIRRALREFPKAKVDQFLRCVNTSLVAIELLDAAPERGRVKALQGQRALVSKFLQMGVGQVGAEALSGDVSDLLRPVAIGATGEFERRFYLARQRAQEAVADYAAVLNEAINSAPRRRPSRPRADANGLLARIARKYQEIFGARPVSTPGGAFSNVVVEVLNYANRKTPEEREKPIDVTRQVRAAIRAM